MFFLNQRKRLVFFYGRQRSIFITTMKQYYLHNKSVSLNLRGRFTFFPKLNQKRKQSLCVPLIPVSSSKVNTKIRIYKLRDIQRNSYYKITIDSFNLSYLLYTFLTVNCLSILQLLSTKDQRKGEPIKSDVYLNKILFLYIYKTSTYVSIY